MSSHKTLIDGTSRTLSGGGCIINGTNYKISSGNTLIDGTSKKIEFEPPKTWKFNEVIDADDVWSFVENASNPYSRRVTFYGNLITPLFGGIHGNGNNFIGIILTVFKTAVNDPQWYVSLHYEYPYPISNTESPLLAYNSHYTYEQNHWVNDSLRTITLDTIPTGTLLSFLQHVATPLY